MDNPQTPQKSSFSSMFQTKKPELPKGPTTPEADSMEVIKDTVRRLRLVEERYANLRKNIQINEQNTISEVKKIRKQVKLLNEDIKDMKHNMREFADELKHIVKELGTTAKREEVKIIDRYLNFLEPLNFIGKNEVEKLIDEKVEEKLEEMKHKK